MTRLRAALVAATVVGSIAASLGAIALDRVLWPFSNYPMYSTLAGPTTAITRAVAVDADGRETPLDPAVQPSGLLLHLAVDHARRAADSSDRLERIARAMQDEHERLRAAGDLPGPALAGLRIYRDTIGLAAEPHARRSVLLVEARRR